MTRTYAADDPSIADRLKEIQAERMAAIAGAVVETPPPAQQPAPPAGDADLCGLVAILEDAEAGG